MQRFVSNTSKACALLGGGLLLLIVCLTVLEVIVRRITAGSIGPVDEISGYLFAASLTLSLGYAFEQRAHIRIDILYARMPAAVRIVADLVALAAMTVFATFLLVRVWSVFATSLEAGSRSNSTLGMPLAIPQGIWVAGLAIFTAILLYYVCASIGSVATGRRSWIAAHISPPDTNEVVTTEMENVSIGKGADVQ
ncbi:MAG: TRAP transporter small permease [Bosea sp. (in: a-proteobacteria)]|nr:TRAP transporter small permease [Bosea sp. (in: a-proteobacteria)]